jgi:hypothetical protein
MLQLWLMPQLQNILMLIFQQDGRPAHFHCGVCQYLNRVLPGCWRGQASGYDQQLTLWSLRSPDIRPHDFFQGYVKDWVFVPPLPQNLVDLKAQIIAAVKNIVAPMLTCVWQELEYCITVCHVTRGAHIEHF